MQRAPPAGRQRNTSRRPPSSISLLRLPPAGRSVNCSGRPCLRGPTAAVQVSQHQGAGGSPSRQKRGRMPRRRRCRPCRVSISEQWDQRGRSPPDLLQAVSPHRWTIPWTLSSRQM
ncbi:hypothetical protein EYF80_039155 [Liparis tanakae]|uniref:Uncharacterized protein n=1 Tax=Liparis tanakae TaxID=230148 RepID=A0A4Z2GDA5_9TELE|nr:hypothetical protein EYF80_039155 [Liparis tanakae]